ncbi:MAG: hypothetical protein ACYC9U_02650 [Nitrososphaerales archaeon]
MVSIIIIAAYSWPESLIAPSNARSPSASTSLSTDLATSTTSKNDPQVLSSSNNFNADFQATSFSTTSNLNPQTTFSSATFNIDSATSMQNIARQVIAGVIVPIFADY